MDLSPSRSSSGEPPAKRRKEAPGMADDYHSLRESAVTGKRQADSNEDSDDYFVDESVVPEEYSVALDKEMPPLKNTPPHLYWTALVLLASTDPQIRAELKELKVSKEYLDRYKFIGPTIEECCKTGQFRKLRRIKVLRVPNAPASDQQDPEIETESQKRATVESWKTEYRGRAVEVLKLTIEDFLQAGSSRPNIYAPYSAIVNSSGTGKSRLVDELGKTVVVVFMCLREDGMTGFPPPDKRIRDWIQQGQLNEEEAKRRTTALVYALLRVTHHKLEHIREQQESPLSDAQEQYRYLAGEFYKCMVEEQTFKEHNVYRQQFYDDVIKEGKEFETKAIPVSTAGNSSPKRLAMEKVPIKDIKTAANALHDFLNPSKGIKGPILVFSFDESHSLTVNRETDESSKIWSIFSHLRRALGDTAKTNIFSLFLSTAGKFQNFSPEAADDLSARIEKKDLKLLPSIPEVGFDELAIRVSENEKTLDDVTEVEFMSHLGRPLFGTRYDAGDKSVRDNLIDFALQKLTLLKDVTEVNEATLACLAVRLAIEFRPKTAKERQIELRQVERHMRICLAASPGFQHIVTVSASEPLLAEAASGAVPTRYIPMALARHLETSGVHRGDRGELAAMLLVTLARDRAARNGQRIISVQNFMQGLLAATFHDSLAGSKPSVSQSAQWDDKEFADVFEDSRIWFNHFIRVEDYDIINVKFLWRLVIRGAAVLCANNQRGVDILIPVVYEDSKRIGRWNVTVILVQVKNDSTFTYNIKPHLFDGMDPFEIGIFSEVEKALPIIRMVFALAATRPEKGRRKSAVQIVTSSRHSTRKKRRFSFTSWDIWCAGLDHETFAVVDPDQLAQYRSILGRSYIVDDAYLVTDHPLGDYSVNQERAVIRRRMHPASRASLQHFESYIVPATDETESIEVLEEEAEEEEVAIGLMPVDPV